MENAGRFSGRRKNSCAARPRRSGSAFTQMQSSYGRGESGITATPLFGRGESGITATPLLGRGESGITATPLFDARLEMAMFVPPTSVNATTRPRKRFAVVDIGVSP